MEVPTEEGEAARTSGERVVVVPGHFDGLHPRLEVVVRGLQLDRKVLLAQLFKMALTRRFHARPRRRVNAALNNTREVTARRRRPRDSRSSWDSRE